MSNPILNENTFINESYTQNYAISDVMTKNGVITKTAGLLLLVLFTAVLACFKVMNTPAIANGLLIVGAIGGLVTAIITAFNKTITHLLAPLYAIFEGLVIGVASLMFESMFPGIVFQAILGTFAVFFTILALYTSRVIVVTQKMRAIIFSSTIAIAVVYLVAFLLSFINIRLVI